VGEQTSRRARKGRLQGKGLRGSAEGRQRGSEGVEGTGGGVFTPSGRDLGTHLYLGSGEDRRIVRGWRITPARAKGLLSPRNMSK